MTCSQCNADLQCDKHALVSLTEWSHSHIRDVFESTSEKECIQAIQGTFASDITASINGKQANFDEIVESVLRIRGGSEHGLKVEWRESVEAPRDGSNRAGTFGGSYVIHGIHKTSTKDGKTLDFQRQKIIVVQ
ncbi:hypothetical protein JR316_0005741 [Psilocybe cubensis]|uniref:Uncharacterized protein n=2 Tax=Psilocybe cubensis TaxID=181762 RepID=A0A8H8CMF4_PSICU|nr:hypothetical protein JR316_0005741 [Psilocybe cubensis]KAH9481220.1 hypothetical protein JR316_0005741 [Psilocybe cubensis]